MFSFFKKVFIQQKKHSQLFLFQQKANITLPDTLYLNGTVFRRKNNAKLDARITQTHHINDMIMYEPENKHPHKKQEILLRLHIYDDDNKQKNIDDATLHLSKHLFFDDIVHINNTLYHQSFTCESFELWEDLLEKKEEYKYDDNCLYGFGIIHFIDDKTAIEINHNHSISNQHKHRDTEYQAAYNRYRNLFNNPKNNIPKQQEFIVINHILESLQRKESSRKS